MQVTIELPEKVAELLARDSRDLSRAVLETVLVTAICERRISQAEARRILGVSRYEMDGLLKRHGAGFDITIDGLERDTAAAFAFSAE
jgi:predicted HTH domain antitoxin